MASARGSSPSTEPWLACAYGLTLESLTPILGLGPDSHTPHDRSGGHQGPRVTVTVTREAEPAAGWRTLEVVVMAHHAAPDGGLAMAVESHPRLGYRMSAPGYGWATIDRSAGHVSVSRDGVSEWRWQRYLLAQVLPFAAGLHGLELLHAAGVTVDAGAVVLVAGSGTGKSTLAAELLGEGAGFLSDDVVALELGDDGDVLAHPGPAVIVLDEAAAKRVTGIAGALLWGDEGEIAVGVAPGAATRVSAVVLLERAGEGAPVVERLSADDPRPLLAGAYETVRRDPDRIAAQLSLLARLAASARLLRVRVPVSGSPRDAAKVLREALEDPR